MSEEDHPKTEEDPDYPAMIPTALLGGSPPVQVNDTLKAIHTDKGQL